MYVVGWPKPIKVTWAYLLTYTLYVHYHQFFNSEFSFVEIANVTMEMVFSNVEPKKYVIKGMIFIKKIY